MNKIRRLWKHFVIAGQKISLLQTFLLTFAFFFGKPYITLKIFFFSSNTCDMKVSKLREKKNISFFFSNVNLFQHYMDDM